MMLEYKLLQKMLLLLATTNLIDLGQFRLIDLTSSSLYKDKGW